MVTLDDIVRSPSAWLDGKGPQAGIVLSSRLRLARNLSTIPFPARARKEQLNGVIGTVIGAARGALPMAGAGFLAMNDLRELDRTFLVERHLISRDLSQGSRARGVLVAPGEGVSIMVNEEDHLRLQAVASGFDLADVWARVSDVDEALDRELDYAFRNDYGYLTACPTNVGTGMRASVLIHLPALVLTKQLKKVLQGVAAVGLAVRGFYGEGTDVMGNFFQVSNQQTLGRSELEILENLERVTNQLIEFEGRAREAMLRTARLQVEDKVWRAYGTLRYSRSISSQEVISLSSAVRFGLAMGIEGLIDLMTLNEIMVYSQPAHIQELAGQVLEPSERNSHRAEMIRRKLSSADA